MFLASLSGSAILLQDKPTAPTQANAARATVT
jgi:hypothetical protein